MSVVAQVLIGSGRRKVTASVSGSGTVTLPSNVRQIIFTGQGGAGGTLERDAKLHAYTKGNGTGDYFTYVDFSPPSSSPNVASNGDLTLSNGARPATIKFIFRVATTMPWMGVQQGNYEIDFDYIGLNFVALNYGTAVYRPRYANLPGFSGLEDGENPPQLSWQYKTKELYDTTGADSSVSVYVGATLITTRTWPGKTGSGSPPPLDTEVQNDSFLTSFNYNCAAGTSLQYSYYV